MGSTGADSDHVRLHLHEGGEVEDRFLGEKSSGWHYELIFVIINLVILLTDGGRFTLSHWFVHPFMIAAQTFR